MLREIPANRVTNGTFEITTERGPQIGPSGVTQTWINATVREGCICAMLSNTPSTRAWLRRAYRLMCAEAYRNRRKKCPLNKDGDPTPRNRRKIPAKEARMLGF